MSVVCDTSRFSAYLDGELPPADRQAIEMHVAQCPSCAAELESLRRLSASIATYPFDDLRPDELSRLHHAIAEAAGEDDDAVIFRISRSAGLIAASILVVAGTWLAALPKPGNDQQQPNQAISRVAQAPEWERAAT